MVFEKKLTVLSVLTAGIGLGSVFLLGRSLLSIVSRWRFLRVTGALIDELKTRLCDPISSTTVVTNKSEWDRIHAELIRHSNQVPILGLDCEWVSANRQTKPIALIQLSSYRGECALIRVSHMPDLPQSLVELLCNPYILKVGVATCEDGAKLRKDMNIHLQGVFDVRHLIRGHEKEEILLAKSGLAGLSENLLGIQLNKKYTVQCSDWEADALTDTQIKYAAQDAIASIVICMKLIADKQSRETKLSPFHDVHAIYDQWTSTAAPLFTDTKFRLPRKEKLEKIKHSKFFFGKMRYKMNAANSPLPDNPIIDTAI